MKYIFKMFVIEISNYKEKAIKGYLIIKWKKKKKEVKEKEKSCVYKRS